MLLHLKVQVLPVVNFIQTHIQRENILIDDVGKKYQ
jgi:hypothetical protein